MSDPQLNHHVSHLRHRSHRSYTSLAPSAMHSPTSEYPFTARSTAAGSSFTPDQFRVLQDMQRVLYRGYEIGERMAGKEEVRGFIEDRFDSDCREFECLSGQTIQSSQHIRLTCDACSLRISSPHVTKYRPPPKRPQPMSHSLIHSTPFHPSHSSVQSRNETSRIRLKQDLGSGWITVFAQTRYIQYSIKRKRERKTSNSRSRFTSP
jgi:hypothetical protein